MEAIRSRAYDRVRGGWATASRTANASRHDTQNLKGLVLSRTLSEAENDLLPSILAERGDRSLDAR